MSDVKYLTIAELEAGLPHIGLSPKDNGRVESIVRRPNRDEREILHVAELSSECGLVGDNWRVRKSNPNPNTQLTLMNARIIALCAGSSDRWALAGDQLFVDLDLSTDNLPAGTRLTLGSAVLEISQEPHTGCKKFIARFGQQAMDFVNSPLGRRLNLRGIYARVVQPGTVCKGDVIRKL